MVNFVSTIRIILKTKTKNFILFRRQRIRKTGSLILQSFLLKTDHIQNGFISLQDYLYSPLLIVDLWQRKQDHQRVMVDPMLLIVLIYDLF